MTIEYKKEIFGSFLEIKKFDNATSSCWWKFSGIMNYDRKKQEELLYNEKVRHLILQSDAIEMSNMIL